MEPHDTQNSQAPQSTWSYADWASRFAAQIVAWLWRHDPGRTNLTALLGRYSAHLAILVVAIAFGITERILASSPSESEALSPSTVPVPALISPAEDELTAIVAFEIAGYAPAEHRGITREASPLTIIPERVRLEMITYTVQEGDNIFLIAEAFKLSPYTIVWSNMETLQGAPWLLQPGLPLLIPPTDGAYHTVKAGETPGNIAESYAVDVTALYNIWNPIEAGSALTEGMLLVIPAGVGPDFDWEPPPPPTPVPAPAQPNTGVAAAVRAPVVPAASATANGWFVLPTGSYAVSGYVFGDYRNPRHIGLDYRCRSGDPIYAADGGTVIFAGWGGGYGNLVRVDHGNGFVTYYGHFSGFAVTSGQAVAQNQVIGYCGTTGASTGPHLHYEIRLNGVPQNPVIYEP